MKWVLIFLVFNGVEAPVAIHQEFGSAKACNDARTVMAAKMPYTIGFRFPLD